MFAPFGESGVAAGSAYADCLAGVRGAVDVDGGHDQCRRAAIAALDGAAAELGEFDRQLQALEAEISNAT